MTAMKKRLGRKSASAGAIQRIGVSTYSNSFAASPSVQGRKLSLQVGFSHPVDMEIPEGITVEVPQPTHVVVKSVDKEKVGEFAARIRKVRPPEPSKGKGIRYENEQIIKKAGKAFGSSE